MIKRNILYILITSLFAHYSIAQQNTSAVYNDPVTSGAMVGAALMLKSEQKKTQKEQKKLEIMQAWCNTQLAKANDIHGKILKGFSEVSGTITNGIQVKEILSNVIDCSKYIKEIGNIVKAHPVYSAFGVKVSFEATKKVTKLSSDVIFILKGGYSNLSSAGERYKMLMNLNDDVYAFKIQLLSMILILNRSVEIGFWKSINPFQGYINTDVGIIENIMYRYKNNF